MVLGALILAALAGTLDLSDRSEFRLRLPGTSALGATVPGKGSLDLETDPEAKLTLASHEMTYELSYAPELVAWDMNLGLQPAFLNTGKALVEWRGRRLRLSLSETASYGLRSFASLSLPTGTGSQAGMQVVTALPTTTTIPYDSSTTEAEAALSLRRWSFNGSAGYIVAGGATAVARETVPSQAGPIGTLGADYSLTHTDHLVATATGSAPATTTTAASIATAPAGANAAPTGTVQINTALAEIDEAWRHDWSRTTYTLVRGGVSGGESNGPLASVGFEWNAVGEALLGHTFRGADQAGDIAIDASVRPIVNPLLGNIDERVQASLVAHYAYGHVGLHGQITLSESVPPSSLEGVRIFYSEVASSYAFGRSVLLEIGSRAFWQAPTVENPPPVQAGGGLVLTPPAAAFQQEVAFVALTVRLDPVHF